MFKMEQITLENQILELDTLCTREFQCKSVTPILRNLTELMKNDHFRCEIDMVYWNTLTKAVKNALHILDKEDFEGDELAFLIELFRFLRNSCAGSAKNQQYIFSLGIIREYASRGIDCFMKRSSEDEIIVLRCCLQLYGNLVCCGNNLKYFVWDYFVSKSRFNQLFEHSDTKVREYAMMVLYNCMVAKHMEYILNTRQGQGIMIALTDALCLNLVDWGILFLELVLKQEDCLHKCYQALPYRNRLLMLDLVTEQLCNSCTPVPLSHVDFVRACFVDGASDGESVGRGGWTQVRALEMAKMLSLLCAASVGPGAVLKSCPRLLATCIDLLRSIHFVTKKRQNVSTAIRHPWGSEKLSKEAMEIHPSYGFKKNLVRLIGNLSYCCRENQDLVRKMEGIPLLLDCCCLDEQNPFIMQWCILAIRNIMEKNSENQGVLAGITASGTVVNSELIEELGFNVVRLDGRLALWPRQEDH